MSESLSSKRRGRGLFIGKWFGIDFYLDYSWFPIAAFVTYALAVEFIPESIPDQAITARFALALVTAALFFLSILLHELGHSLVSQRCGIAVPRITLLFIGGLAEISREPDDAKSELKIALGGPAVSVALVVVYQTLAWFGAWLDWNGFALICAWLAGANLVLVVFNMFPGYPLDGGRVLRAILWMKWGRLRRATYVASRIGIGFAWLLFGFGIWLLVVPPHGWNGFLFMLIGLFLRNAAEGGYQNAVQREVLAGVTIGEVMTRAPFTIPDHLPLNRAVEEFFLLHHYSSFPVCTTEGDFRGLLALDMVKSVPRARWPYTTAGDVVAEADERESCLEAGEPAARTMRLMLTRGQRPLAVLENGQLTGIVTRSDLLRFIEIRTALET